MSGGNFDDGMKNATAANGTGTANMPPGFASVYETTRIVSACCYVVILVFSVIGNSAIVAIVSSNKNMRTKANVLIVNMAISDLIATICTVPRMIEVEITGSNQWKVSGIIAEITCKLSAFTREVSCAVSILSLVAIAIDRFYAIVTPMANKPRVLKLMFLMPMIWTASVIANALYLHVFQIKTILINGKVVVVCYNILTNHQEMIYDTFRFVLFIAGPLLLLAGLYIAIGIKMSAQNIPGTNVEVFAKSRRKQNKNVVKLAVVIVVSFTVCWLPYHIGLLLHAFYWNSKQVSPNMYIPIYILQTTFIIFTYASFAINPYICLTFSSNFRRGARRTLVRMNPSRRAVSRISTTTTNPNGPRALSMSNVEISLENFHSNTTSRRGIDPDLETPLELDLQGFSRQQEKINSSVSNDEERIVPNNARTSRPTVNHCSENQERIANHNETQRLASLNETYHSKETYLNRGFEDKSNIVSK